MAFQPNGFQPDAFQQTGASGGGGGSVGSAIGTCTADAFAQVIGAATGIAIAAAVAGFTGQAAGTSTVGATAGAVASAAGTSAASAVAGATASATGTSTADGFSQGGSVASATGTSTAAAVAGFTAQASGTSTADAVAQIANTATASAAGTSTAEAVMGYTGRATGTSTAFGVPFGAPTFAKGNWVVSQNEFNIWSPSFTPSFGEGKTISVTTTSAQAQWASTSRAPANAQKFLLVNQTAQACFVRWGVGNQTALVDVDMPLSAYGMIIVQKGLADTVAAITPTGTTTLSVMPGVGV